MQRKTKVLFVLLSLVLIITFYCITIEPFAVDIQGTYYEKTTDNLISANKISIAFDILEDKKFYITDFNENRFYIGDIKECGQGCYLLTCNNSDAQEYFPVQILKLRTNNKKITLTFASGEKEFVKRYNFLMFQGHNSYV